MSFLKKLGKKTKGLKKLGKKSLSIGGRLGKKSGRVIELGGQGLVALGTVTGQPEITASGQAAMSVGQLTQETGQLARDLSKGRLEKASKRGINLVSK